MKTKLAISAFVAAFVLSACGSKTEAPPAPAADATPPAATPAPEMTPAPAPADQAADAAKDAAGAMKPADAPK
jgi:hypothetical protein